MKRDTDMIPDQYTVLRSLDDYSIVLFSAYPIPRDEADAVFSRVESKVESEKDKTPVPDPCKECGHRQDTNPVKGTAKVSLDHAQTVLDDVRQYMVRDDTGYIFDVIVGKNAPEDAETV